MSYRRMPDLTKLEGTIGKVMTDHRARLMECQSSAEAFDILSKLFTDNQIDTPKSRKILFTLQMGMAPGKTLIYLQDIIFKSAGMGVI